MLRGLFALALIVTAACDVRPLTSRELYGAAGTGGMDAGGVDATDGAAPPTDVSPEVPASPCAQVCSVEQFCDELTRKCVPQTGLGVLSGAVIDDCTNQSIDARVNILRRRRCSYPGKGAYSFTGLPLIQLTLTAWKENYQRYEAVVEIVSGGVIHDIHMVRVGGCAAPAPEPVACVCDGPDCEP
jgi:hypothetical protein